ncbi:MAG: CinA family nicotinamide mononucleotide deamidase-related protein [Dysgonamonadaceae bacterium]|jgi:nicotinamide-nucleotide amidase|nr:CinA family nicotinamide mononucleotide deamidase-related protein [Dysgonamonadaceae bacterium]
MRIEIITIGDEILIGQVVDTNSAWMGRELTQRGFEITAISSVGDETGEIVQAIDIAFECADILLLTGGVGPTNDDITKYTLCEYFDTSLIFDPEVLKNIELIFQHRNIQMNELTRNQAYVPMDCTVIQNKVGTAPILWFENQGKVLISMPGVPFEMKTAMTDEIIPRLQQQFQTEKYLRRSFLLSGIPESALALHLADFENKLPKGFSLAYLPSFGFIRLRLSVWGEENTDELNKNTEKLNLLIKEWLISRTDKSPELLIGEKLLEKQLNISTAESCTGGNIAHRITKIAGASAYFEGSIVSYSNNVKAETLGVDKTVLKTCGAVSREVVEQMAVNVATQLKTDCSIAVSGIMGPDGGTTDKPVGMVWICTNYCNKLTTQQYNVGVNRAENIERVTNLAILQLLKSMIN